MAAVQTVTDYIEQASGEKRERLELVRAIILSVAPGAEELISWGMPTFRVGKNQLHVGCAKHHVGLYPGSEAVRHFADQTAELGLACTKGSIHLPDSRPIPAEFVADVAAWCLSPSHTRELRDAPKARERQEMPDWVRVALHEAALEDAFAARPPYQRNDYIGWIVRPKREATRQAHLAQMLDELRRGDVYMRMPWHARG